MTRSTFIASHFRRGLPLQGVRAAIALGAALIMAPTLVLAEALVRGSPAAVTIEAQNASVEDILAALSAAFDVHYRSSANLDKRLNGTYEGPLKRVVARILEGYNFFLKTGDGTIEITVLGTGTGAPFKAAERRAGAATAQSSPAVEQSVPPASPAAPAPVIKIAEGPTPPIPSPAPSGLAPTLVPGPGLADAPLAAPPAPTPGSTPGPIPQAVPSTDGPMPMPSLTSTSVPAPSAIMPPPAAGTTPPPSPRAPPGSAQTSGPGSGPAAVMPPPVAGTAPSPSPPAQ